MLTAAGTPSLPSHVVADVSLTQRMRGDTCFKCKSQGHWARYCPLSSPSPSSKSPPPSSSSSLSPLPPSKVGGLPVVQCPCGSGACVIRISGSAKNPNRKFFACPTCKFFNGWCDEVSAPVCPCRAGTCSVNTDPVSKKKFFACRIKKGHGACGFFQWVDEYDASAKVRSAKAENAGSPGNVPPRGVVAGPTAAKENPNYTFADFLEASESDGSVDLISKFEELVDRLSPVQNQSNFDEMTVYNQPSIRSSGSEDFEMEERNPPSDLDETLPVSHRPSSFTDFHFRQTEFLKQLSAAAGDTVTGGNFPSLDDVAASDYANLDAMDRTSCLMLPSNPHSTQGCRHNLLGSPSVNMAVAEDCTIRNFVGMENGNGNPLAEEFLVKLKHTANAIKCELVKKLESSDQHDPAQLRQDATVYFTFLDLLRIDSQQFKDCINTFIQHASSLAEIRTGERSFNVLLERYHEEKRQFEELSCIESKTLNACAGCNGQIEFLRQEVLRLKRMLLHVEKELSDREEEFIGLNNNLGDIRNKVELAKASMDNASTNAAEASRILESMELERSAMKATLEEAKEQLNR